MTKIAINGFGRKSSKGFTLIELLVVIAIIGLLASVVLVSLNTARVKARDARRKTDLHQIQVALEMYYDDNGTYPATCSWSSWGCWPTFIPSQYISKVPVDPTNLDLGNCHVVPNCYLYHYCKTASDKYVLIANLENAVSPSMGNRADCSHGGPNWFWIAN